MYGEQYTHKQFGVVFWSAPAIHCIAETHFPYNEAHVWRDEEMEFGELVPDTTDEDLIELAGKGCYWSYGKGRTGADYIKHIMESGHGSVLEHVNVTLGFKGISRTLSHELVRHRHLSFSQLSQRYSDLVEFVVPPNMKPEQLGAFEGFCYMAWLRYKQMLGELPDTKAGKEVARSVLPGATATRIIVTGNLRSWRDFVLKRGAKGADAEMVRLAKGVLELMQCEAPTVFGDITETSEGFLESKYGCV